MAEVVQGILDGMVPDLRDLMEKGIFSESEIHAIVTRRRNSEYLLRRREARKADFLRYIQDEMSLERLRVLRKSKLSSGRRHNTSTNQENNNNSKQKQKKYKHSMGDGHMVKHIHFIYTRLTRKFKSDVDLHFAHAAFCKRVRSYKRLGKIYAEALQIHPRNSSLWIASASHEFFGDEDCEGEEIKKDTKVYGVGKGFAGGSIRNARVLLQRGLRVMPNNRDLWVQYFSLEWHYVQKVRGRREILKLTDGESMEKIVGEEEDEESLYRGAIPKVIYRNAIKAIPDCVEFRLRFLDSCQSFPQTELVEREILESIDGDFGDLEKAWIVRAQYANHTTHTDDDSGDDEDVTGFLANPTVDTKKRKRNDDDETNPTMHALKKTISVLNQAVSHLATPEMYLQSISFLQNTLLLPNHQNQEDITKLLVTQIDQLFTKAVDQNIQSVDLIYQHAQFLLSTNRIEDAIELLSSATHKGTAKFAQESRLWLELGRIVQTMELMKENDDTIPTTNAAAQSALSILKKASKTIPVSDGPSHLRVLMALLDQYLLLLSNFDDDNSNSNCDSYEKGAAQTFQRILLLTRYDPDQVASTSLRYLQYESIRGGIDAARRVYDQVLFQNTNSFEDGEGMEVFLDAVISLEKSVRVASSSSTDEDKRLKRVYQAIVSMCRQDGTCIQRYKRGMEKDLGFV